MDKYRIEFVPRYGTILGIIWVIRKQEEDSDIEQKEETIGHIRIQNDEEKEEWTTAIQELNKSLKEE